MSGDDPTTPEQPNARRESTFGAPMQSNPQSWQLGSGGPSAFGGTDSTAKWLPGAGILAQRRNAAQDNSDAESESAFGAPVQLDPTVQMDPTAQSDLTPQLDPAMQWRPDTQAQREPTAQWPSGGPSQQEPTVHWQPTASYPQSSSLQSPPSPPVQPAAPFQSGYGPIGRPSGGRGKTWLAAAVAVLVVAGGATTAVVLANEGSDDTSARGASPSMVSALTTTSHTSAPPKTSTPSPSAAVPIVPGYQVVVAPESGAAYDVPADWNVAPPGTVGGFGEPPRAVTGKGLAIEGKGYCPGSTRTVSFLTLSKNADPATAATELGTTTAEVAYQQSPGGAPSQPEPLISLDGSQHGMFVETRGSVSSAQPGCATEYSVYTYAAPTDRGNFVMVIAADIGVPNAVDAATAKQIFTSIRPHEG